MWTITNEQLKNIAQSMRHEFEQRAFYILLKEECTKGMAEEKIKQNIQKQSERLAQFKIKDEELSLQFIRLSFEYPALQAGEWDELLENELLQSKEEAEKIEILTNYLI
jgi:hypothetical protein